MAKRYMRILLSIFILFCTFSVRILPVQAEDSIVSGLYSQYAYVIDYESGQVLGDKNAEQKMYPASMTKMLTAIIAIENLPDLDQKVTITSTTLDGLAEMNASVAGFKIGDTPTVRDLLYGAALPSGADAANALAIAAGGTIAHFVELMNQKAASIGMNSSHFTNTTGLHDDNLYSTAKDIAALLRYCIQNETFAAVFSTQSYTTTSLASHPDGITFSNSAFTVAEKNGLDITGMIGAKTGYTDEGGHCMASWLNVNDMHIIAVTAKATEDVIYYGHAADLQSIIAYLRTMKKNIAASPEITVKSIQMKSYFTSSKYEVVIPDTLWADVLASDKVKFTTDLPDEIELMNEAQDFTYTLTVTINDTFYESRSYSITIPADQNPITRLIRSMIHLFQ